MTDLIVHPSILSGKVDIPSSKSHSIRAIIFASLAQGTSHIYKRLDSPDIHHTIKACRQIGAEIQENGDDLIIRGTAGHFNAPKDEIDSGNSGQVLRFIGTLAALGAGETILTGDHSIQTRRPVKPLIDALKQLGASARSLKNNDCAPIAIKGIAKPGTVLINGQDSQPVSGLLMLAAFLEGETTIKVNDPGEKPWIDLTLYWLDKFDIPYENDQYKHYKVTGKKILKAFDYTVAGDFSSAAFPAAAALLSNSKITLNNMNMDDPQGDKKIFEAFKKMGALISYDKERRELTIEGSNLVGKELDINDYIDAITILSVVGSFAKGDMHIKNAAIARKKESDRIKAISAELKKMGAKITEKPGGLIVHPSPLNGSTLNTYHDHRMAMSLTIAALHAKGPSKIIDVDCISKSYPSFVNDMQKLGAKIEVI